MGASGAQPAVTIPLESAERFFKTFERSAKRWEMIVYPGMVILVLFMAYGFYLIYNLTYDMRSMVARFDDPQITANLDRLSGDMAALSANIEKMTRQVQLMAKDTRAMAGSTAAMQKNTRDMTSLMASVKYMKSIDQELKRMNQSVYVMGSNMDRMRHDMTVMNRNVSKPFNMMNRFMPF